MLFSSEEKIVTCLDLALRCSATIIVRYISIHYPQVIGLPMDVATMSLPLHRAKSADIATILYDAYPAGVAKQNKLGNLPLHEVITNHHCPSHVQVLIEKGWEYHASTERRMGCEAAGLLVRNQKGHTPFSLLKNLICYGVDISYLSRPLYQIDQGLWNSLDLMIRTLALSSVHAWPVFGSSVGMDSNPIILHQIIARGCPPQAIQMSRIMIPGEISMVDQNGMYPLSLAAAQSSTCPIRVVRDLLRDYPPALRLPDRFGRYPLHWCAYGGRAFSKGTALIYSKDPSIAAIPDKDGFFPFMLAAASPSNGHLKLNLIYMLLRDCPFVLNLRYRYT